VTADAGTTIASGALPLALVLALVAGFVSFASPCVLPLVPGFLGYVTGLSDVALEKRGRGRLLLGALLFVLGFSVVFIAVSATASAVGSALFAHRLLLMRVGGVVVIALALVFLGLGTQRTWQPSWRPAAGLAGAPLLGVVFGLGMSPCTGPTFAAILALTVPLSGGGGGVARGVVLAVAYSLGLGLPFLLIAGGYSRAGRASGWLRRHHRAIQVVGGVLLLAVGLLLVTGVWDTLTAQLQSRLVSGFETVI
jgi:cytochrome c-type biogenesis protein